MQRTYTLKIPVTVEAMQITPDNVKWAATWCRGAVITHDLTAFVNQITGVGVPTLYGVQRAPIGAYLIKNVAGDFTWLEAKEFESKYTIVNTA